MTSGNKNSSLNDAKRAKKDEFYTQLSDIENCQMLCKDCNRRKGGM